MKGIRKLILGMLIFTLALCLCVGCSGRKVKLSFETDGGPAVESVKVEKGGEITLPEPSGYKRAGEEVYVFDGWKTEDGAVVRGSVKAPEQNTTYYAVWERGYEVELDPDGGVLDGGQPLYLKEGANVYEAVKNYIPAKELPFGAWFSESGILSESYRMPAERVKLIARYTVGYTVEIHVAALDGSGYVLDAERTIEGSGYAGVETQPEAPLLTGLVYQEGSAENVNRLTLSPDKSANVFRLCYDRQRYNYLFSDNLPSGVVVRGGVEDGEAAYGETVTLPENGFDADGYRFLGWSKSSDESAEYKPGDQVVIERSTVFYAVWDKGFSDRLGGSDYIYFPEDEEEVAILERGGAEFYGIRDGNDFLFEQTGLKGRVSGNTFVYYNTDLAREYVFVGFNVANNPNLSDNEKCNQNITLKIDEYLTATYTEKGENGVVRTITGTLSFDATFGDYLLSSNGASLHVNLGTFTKQSGETIDAFSVRGEEANATDLYYQAIPHGEGAVMGNYAAAFDGYGTFALIDTNWGDEYLGLYYLLETYYDENGGNIYEMVGVVSDDWGELTGVPGAVVSLEFYTREIGPAPSTMYYFIQRDNSAGEYKGENDARLTLDGFGLLPDSAVYEADGKTYVGSYTYSNSEVFGGRIYATLSLLASGESVGEAKEFVFTLNGNRFVEEESEKDAILAEYLLFAYDDTADDGRGAPDFVSPFTALVIYETTVTLDLGVGLKAEIWVREEQGAHCAARGYVTAESFGTNELEYYTFTATEASGTYTGLESLKCMTNLTTPDGVSYYDVFYILEYNGEARYTEHEEVDAEGNPTGGKLWHMMLNEGMGSLYFSADGKVYEGSLSYEASEFFSGSYTGTFVWINYDAGTYDALYFAIDNVYSENYKITPLAADELERPLYQIRYGVLDTMVNFMVTGPQSGGNAVYNESGLNAGTPQSGAFSPTDRKTIYGETIYQFTVSGRARWYFVMADYYYAPQDIWIKVYYKANGLDEAASKTYTTDDGSTLTTDGFHMAELATADGRKVYGEYYLDEYGTSLNFTSDDGTGRSYLVNGNNLSKLDSAYGTWNLYDGIRKFYGEIVFDGRGGCILHYELPNGGTQQVTGVYRPLEDEEQMSCILTIDIGEGSEDYYAVFRIISLFEIELKECTIRDDDTYGIFRGDDMSVLALDGLGYGTFYDARGNVGDYGYLEMLSEEDNFACFSSYNNYDVTYFLLLDSENKRYTVQDYSNYGQVYYAEDLQGVAFGADGNASFPFGFGPYFVDEAGAHVFVRNSMSGNYEGYDVPAPTSGEYRYEEKTYFRWEASEAEIITFEGEITFVGENSIRATLTVTLDGDPWLDTAAVLSAEEQEYSGLSFVYLNIGAQGLRSGAYLRDSNMNYFPLSVQYHPKGNSTFEAEGDSSQKTVLQDGYEADAQVNGELNHPISTLTTTYKGFGPIVLSEPKIEGTLYYQPLMTDSNPFTFTADANDVTLIGEDYSEGKLYLLPFEKGGEKYAMSYYSNSGRFELYMMMKYTKVEVDTYKVGVGNFLYSNRFSFPGIEKDDFCAAVVYQKDGEAIVAYNQFCYPEQAAAWLIDLGSYDQFEGTGTLGKAYWIEVTFEGKTAVSATVREYTLQQALSADGLYLVNFFLNEKGEIEKLAALAVSDGGFVFVRFDSVEKKENNYEVKDGNTVYTVEIELDENGEKRCGDLNEQGMLVPAENGEYWFITVERA